MPRIARVVIIGCPHHITQRGNYQQETFSVDSDYEKYLGWMSEYHKKYKLNVLAFCLMPNHVHFISVPEKQDSLSKTFNTCHMKYSRYYNKKNNNKGHLWQGRFYSCPLDESHLYEAVRYVENNPVRAKLVKRADQWQWSSAKEHLKKGEVRLSLENIQPYLNVLDWRQYLMEKQDDNIIKKVKSNTLTGRPSGSNSFMLKIEGIVGRRLRPLPEGRPWSKRQKEKQVKNN